MSESDRPNNRLTVQGIAAFYKEDVAVRAGERAQKTGRKIMYHTQPRILELGLQPGRYGVFLDFTYEGHGANEQDIDQFILSLAAHNGENKNVLNVRASDWKLVKKETEVSPGQWIVVA